MTSRMCTRSCKQFTSTHNIYLYYILCITVNKDPTYGELIDFLNEAERSCSRDKSTAELLCSKTKEAYPHIRIARTKRFYDTIMNIAAPVMKGKLSESELMSYRDRKWIPRIRNSQGRLSVQMWCINISTISFPTKRILSTIVFLAWAVQRSMQLSSFRIPNRVIIFELNCLLSCMYGFKWWHCHFLIWKLVGYNGLWIWIVMAPGNIHKFHDPSAAHELLTQTTMINWESMHYVCCVVAAWAFVCIKYAGTIISKSAILLAQLGLYH